MVSYQSDAIAFCKWQPDGIWMATCKLCMISAVTAVCVDSYMFATLMSMLGEGDCLSKLHLFIGIAKTILLCVSFCTCPCTTALVLTIICSQEW